MTAGTLILPLLLLNASLYSFFLRKRGLWFTLKVIPWHWFYYLYGGLAFGIAVVMYPFKGKGLKTSYLMENPEKGVDKAKKGLS